MSMTREEAIEIFEQKGWWIAQKETLTSKQAEEIIKLNNAVNFALSALRPISRERIEEAWRGGWIAVRESEITGFNPEFAGHDPIGGYKCSQCKAEAVLDCNDEFVLDNFCPRCGAAMTDEAVEMVMERMEAIDGETD